MTPASANPKIGGPGSASGISVTRQGSIWTRPMLFRMPSICIRTILFPTYIWGSRVTSNTCRAEAIPRTSSWQSGLNRRFDERSISMERTGQHWSCSGGSPGMKAGLTKPGLGSGKRCIWILQMPTSGARWGRLPGGIFAQTISLCQTARPGSLRRDRIWSLQKGSLIPNVRSTLIR